MLTTIEPDGVHAPDACCQTLLPQARQEIEATNVTCNSCALARLCTAEPVDTSAAERLNESMRCIRMIKRGQALYRRGGSLQSIYAIRAGSFKTVIHRTGGAQVVGIALSGDPLGIDGIASGKHAYDAIALEDSSVCVMPFERLERLCHDLKIVQRHVLSMLSAEIVRGSKWMGLLGTMGAEDRVATFLFDLSERWSARGFSSTQFTLKMTRAEIGSYLGLKLETVSRILTKLQQRRLLEVRGKDIRILDMDRFQAVAMDGCTPFSGSCSVSIYG